MAARLLQVKTRATPGRHAGFTYLGVMFLVMLLALTAAMASVVWSTEQRRENERQLVFVGLQFQAAIERYRQRSKDGEAAYPRRLEDLVRDARALNVVRHLRQVFPDPLTGSTRWGLVRLPDGGIVGVYSLSDRAPLQRGSLAQGLSFPDAKSYRDWRFIAPSATELLILQQSRNNLDELSSSVTRIHRPPFFKAAAQPLFVLFSALGPRPWFHSDLL